MRFATDDPMETNGKVCETTSIRPADTAVPTDGPLASGEHFRPIALAGLTVVLFVLCFWLALPFLSAMAWAVALAIIAWPMHKWIRRRIGPPSRAALASTLVTVMVIVMPGLFVAYRLASEVSSANDRMKAESIDMTLRSRIASDPSLRPAVEWLDRINIDVDAEVRKLVTAYVAEPSGLLRGSVIAVIHFAIMLFILYHFLKDGPTLRGQIRTLLPMSRAECDRVFSGVADSVHANVYATVITSLIDGVSGGLMFWILGLPSPVLWGVVIFVVSILPILGTFLVWVPASVYLVLSNDWLGAILLALWGVGTAIAIDSLLYARLAGDRMRLHPVPVLLAFLGGLALFGPAGMILGPAILAVTAAVLDVWHCRAEAADRLPRDGSLAPTAQSVAAAKPTDGTAPNSRERAKAKR